jgi:hypothetical protein
VGAACQVVDSGEGATLALLTPFFEKTGQKEYGEVADENKMQLAD